MRRTSCTIRLAMVGMPMGLCLPFAFGMYTLRTGIGSKVLALRDAWRRVIFPSRSPRNRDIVSRSTPAVSLPWLALTCSCATRSQVSLQSRPIEISKLVVGVSCSRLTQFLLHFTDIHRSVPYVRVDYLCFRSLYSARGLRHWASFSPLCPCRRLSRLRTTTPHPPLSSGIGISSRVSPVLLSTFLGIPKKASRVHDVRL